MRIVQKFAPLIVLFLPLIPLGAANCGALTTPASSVTSSSAEENNERAAKGHRNAEDTKIETEDVVARAGESFIVRAELEAKHFLGIANDLAHLPVEFYSDTKLLGSAVTDKEGKAEITLRFDKAQELLVTITFPGTKKYRPCTAQSDVFILDASGPIILVDIDHTVADVSSLGVVFESVGAQKSVPGAPETLAVLATDYQIVFLTHRSTVLATKTKAWLREQKFPRAPVIFWHPGQEPLLPEAYKTKAIARLKQRFSNIVAGIGDRKADADAYLENGLKAYILSPEGLPDSARRAGAPQDYPKGTILVKDWNEILSAFEAKKQ
jgi:phosphatidate phosphatase APP1